MTVTASATRTIAATPEEIWAVLADFGNIAQWSRAVQTSNLTGPATGGVGATRHCELSVGSLDETVTAWQPGELLGIAVDIIAVAPMRHVDTTFALQDNGDGTTDVTMTSEVEPKGGIFAGLVGRRLRGGLPKAAGALLSDLEQAAVAARNTDRVA